MLLLSGGTGTPKLLRGLKEIIPHEKITVVVNTAEDRWISGNLVCPDVDTVIYTFADIIDDSKWWGIKGDTFNTHNQLRALGNREVMMIGDRDRATHVLRSNLLRRGEKLTGATKKICEHYDIKAKILPMSDDALSTYINTAEKGWMHFQDFWITHGGKLTVKKVEIRGIGKVAPGSEVIAALEREEVVVIGPSNPVTSIGPIVNMTGIKKLLREKYVVAMSPFIRYQAVSGPAGKFMRSLDLEASSAGVATYYREFLDEFIIDAGDELQLEDIKIVRADILMTDKAKSIEMARAVKKIVEGRGK